MKNFGLLWARGMPGAGNAGRRVSEESESSTAGSPHLPSATALLWVVRGDSWNVSIVTGGACTLREESVPEATPESGLILQWCFWLCTHRGEVSLLSFCPVHMSAFLQPCQVFP